MVEQNFTPDQIRPDEICTGFAGGDKKAITLVDLGKMHNVAGLACLKTGEAGRDGGLREMKASATQKFGVVFAMPGDSAVAVLPVAGSLRRW